MPSAVEFSTTDPIDPKVRESRGDRIRTRSRRFWRPVLNQLSYTPMTDYSPYKKMPPGPCMGGRRRRFRVIYVRLPMLCHSPT